jgi:oxygen-dependent protoporphyrinogen oxidase
MMAGIYVADPERLSIQSTFPQMAGLERRHGSLVKGMRHMLKQRRKQGTRPQPLFMSFKSGMGELVEALGRELDGEVRLRAPVREVRPLIQGYAVDFEDETLPALATEAVLLAAPAPAASRLLAGMQADLARRLDTIRYVSTATVTLVLRRGEASLRHEPDGFGFVVAKQEPCDLLACTWSSVKFAHRAPDDTVLLRAFIGGAGREHLAERPDAELLELVTRELGRIMGLSGEPSQVKIFRWPKANPQYDVGHGERYAEIEQRLSALPGVALAGGGYGGIGIPDCIHGAQRAVERILDHLAH